MGDDKNNRQQEFAAAIAAATDKRLKPEFETVFKGQRSLTDQIVNLNVAVEEMRAQLSLMQANIVCKRPARSQKRTAGSKPNGKNSGDDPKDKVKNSMLYCRWAWANDEEFKKLYETKELRQTLDSAENIKKLSGIQKLQAEGREAWKQFDDKKKGEVRKKFKDWRENLDNEKLKPQLKTDDPKVSEEKATTTTTTTITTDDSTTSKE